MSVEKAARAEIKLMPAEVAKTALAAAVVELARRLDVGPEDREVTQIARELRLSFDALRRLAAERTTDPLGELDARIGAGTLRH